MGQRQRSVICSPDCETPTHATWRTGPTVRRSATARGPAVPGATLEAVISAEGDASTHFAAPALTGTGSAECPAWQPTHLVPEPKRAALNPGTCAGPLSE